MKKGDFTMTLEQIELRKILTQMLADNGINRETIVPFVKDIIREKVDVSIKRIEEETNLYDMVRKSINKEISDAIRSEVREKVRQSFSSIHVCIDMHSDEE